MLWKMDFDNIPMLDRNDENGLSPVFDEAELTAWFMKIAESYALLTGNSVIIKPCDTSKMPQA